VAKLFCGVDFGTTNSSVAVSDGQCTHVLELDQENDTPTSLPSLLYITCDGEHIIGRAAAKAFIERNIDREVKLEQIDLGIAIEGYVGSEPDKSEGYRPADPVDPQAIEGVRVRAYISAFRPLDPWRPP
jgi:hypothetical chaperone protein